MMRARWRRWLTHRRGESLASLRRRYERFRQLVEKDNRVLELIADASEKSGGDHLFDRHYLEWLATELERAACEVVYQLNALTDDRYAELIPACERICTGLHAAIRPDDPATSPLTLPVSALSLDDAPTVGAKLACLGELRNRLGMPAPDGFVVSVEACRRCFQSIGVEALLPALTETLATGSAGLLEERAQELRRRILGEPLERSVERALRRELGSGAYAGWTFAVRSSALGEDGEFSFAGLHRSVLNVPVSEALTAYREVLASLFSAPALHYRHAHDLPLTGALMAVGFLQLIPAAISGVVHTVPPESPRTNVMRITAAWGLGPTVVQGTGPVDTFELARDGCHEVRSRELGAKTMALRPRAEGDIEAVPVSPAERDVPCLADDELVRLARTALVIERHRGQYQEIEWALQPGGELVILQARPLRLSPASLPRPSEIARQLEQQTALVRGQGAIACSGIGAGRVVVVRAAADQASFPDGAVLVTPRPDPNLAPLLSRASAVVCAGGGATGHLAVIARELRTPMLVGVTEALAVLAPGREVTVDAQENVVYDGLLHDLVLAHRARARATVDYEEFRLLRRLLRQAAPLNLRDPHADNFKPRACRTCHDLVRFAHEMAVRELTELPGLRAGGQRGAARRLALPIPLDLRLIDLGGGLASAPALAQVQVADVRSAPLAALLDPLCQSWRTDPVALDVGSFLASATRATPLGAGADIGLNQNLAVISDEYLNLHLMLGYHFNIVDCRLTDNPSDNYIYFRFQGGVTDVNRRSRRARTIAAILQAHDFVVETRADLVVARLAHTDTATMHRQLAMIGRLIGYTRQLDVLMRDEGSVSEFTRDFMAQHS